VGSADGQPLAAQQALVPLAHRAGIDTCVKVVAGGQHDFDFWTQAFADSLPWLSWRLNLTPAPAHVPATCTPGAR
jgi:S-formylglutathione hydrolase FrmB